ncbi:MAG: fused MFS/spermidine synthase [Actinomycetota bacterium]
MLIVFTVTTFLGAGLVFLVQPMVAKMLLPLLGGTPTVWITAMLFFQVALLAGYGYAHVSISRVGLRRQPLLHVLLLLLPLLLLPIALPEGWVPPVEGSPAAWLLLVLALMVGLPYLVVTTASPVLQRWFSGTGHREATDPYFLYAAGNAGSLLGLLAYPFVIEPRLTLKGQALAWTAGYVGFVILCLVCALFLRRREARRAPASNGDPRTAENPGSSGRVAAIDTRTRLRWLLYAFVPSSLMLGATHHLTTDIAAAPLLWVLPLSVYLLTFVIAFARVAEAVVRWASALLPFAVLWLGLEWLDVLTPTVWGQVARHLVTLLLAGLVCHGRLAAERPAAERLTEFYLLISIGGVLGGVLNALVAPAIFSTLLEYPLVLAVAVFLRPLRPDRRPLLPRFVTLQGLVLAAVVPVLLLWLVPRFEGQDTLVLGLLAATALVVYQLVNHPQPLAAGLAVAVVLGAATIPTDPALYRSRTFFGVQEVVEDGDAHLLYHGTVVHGAQSLTEPTKPVTYYDPTGPIGSFMVRRQLGDVEALDRVAVVGLGTGTLAAYGRTGDSYVFYEIDPEIERIALDPDLFTYLSDSPADVSIELGDGRLGVSRAPSDTFDLILLDAFTSDAIPIHLLTREAVVTYLDKLAPGGVVAFNITNRYVDMRPPLAAIAASLGLSGVVGHDDGDPDLLKYRSTWVLLAPDPSVLPPPDGELWRTLTVPEDASPWTDDFSDIASVLSWT